MNEGWRVKGESAEVRRDISFVGVSSSFQLRFDVQHDGKEFRGRNRDRDRDRVRVRNRDRDRDRDRDRNRDNVYGNAFQFSIRNI